MCGKRVTVEDDLRGMETTPDHSLRMMLDAAIASAQADICVPPSLPRKSAGRSLIVSCQQSRSRHRQGC